MHTDRCAEGFPGSFADSAFSEHLDIDDDIHSCVIVGSGTLSVFCAQRLRKAGYRLAAILATDSALAGWANEDGVRRLSSLDDLTAFVEAERVDWLFSIANTIILPPSLISRLRKGAFNYHDGPLPRYAGSNATSWALLAGETRHAITWHRIGEVVDAGKIAVQRSLEIDPLETALSLNLKCYQAAGDGLTELLGKLHQGALVEREQELTQRSFFAKCRRPEAGGLLLWDRPAESLSAKVRALDFGTYYFNPLCTPKILLQDKIICVAELGVLAHRSGCRPGTLLQVEPNCWKVATGTQDVAISGFSLATGEPVDPAELAETQHLRAGDMLPLLTSPTATADLTKAVEAAAAAEDFWRERLERCNPTSLFGDGKDDRPACWKTSPWHTLDSVVLPDTPVDHTLAAWLTYLARATGEAQLQLGWKVSADTLADVPVPFVLAATVPMEVAADEDLTFCALRTKVAQERAQLRQRWTFAADLIGRHPQLRALETLRLPCPWTITVAVVHDRNSGTESGGVPLTLQICEADGSFRWIYNEARIDATQVERFTASLLTVASTTADPCHAEVPLNRLEILSGGERALLLEAWNDTEASYPLDRCIHELFEEQVKHSPTAVALVQDNVQLTYGDLNTRANQLAHHLIDIGVRPDSRVAICAERTPALIIALMAILKAGGAYVPLDPAYPAERLGVMLQDSAPVALLADARGRAVLGGTGVGQQMARMPVVELDNPGWADRPGRNPRVPALGLTSGHLAYVIYTSGSTGTPKGVMVEHRSIVASTAARNAVYRSGAGNRFLLLSSVAFDSSVAGIFGTLTSGGTLFLSTSAQTQDPVSIADLVVTNGITTLLCVPSFAQLMLSSIPVTGDLPLREVIVAGEPCPVSLLQTVNAAWPQMIIYNEYGPTEATVWASFYRCSGDECGIVPIGRPIHNTRIYLLDRQGQPVPIGAVGELHIGGAGVARGYLNRAALTAERFLADPFAATANARIYRTGDLARYLPDGNIEFLGRADDQVKIRGFRIELGEIETRLAEHREVREAAVVAREDEPGDKRLIAYVVMAPASALRGNPLATELRRHLAARLPEHMIPAAVVALDALPLTPNGKLDRKRLPRPVGDAYARQAYEAPRGEIEQMLAQAWAELLGVDRVGRHDNFFELGGHSLLAVRLIARLRRLGLGTEIGTLFATPDLAGLAASLGAERDIPVPGNVIRPDDPTITPAMLPLIELTQADIDVIAAKVPGGISNIQDIYALSPLQDGILFHHLLADQGDPYLTTGRMVFANRGLVDRYLDAVQRVVDRHDILRTAFLWEGLSNAAQVVLRQAPLIVTEVALDPDDGPGLEQLARRFDPSRHRLDLGQAPLLRFVVARDPDSDRWLVIELLHHLIGDHETIETLQAEVRAFLAGSGDSLASPQPFRNLVAQARLGVSQDEHERFFRAMLGDIDEPTMPFGLADVHQHGDKVDEAYRLLPQLLNDRLRAQARRLAVGVASLCHLAWGQVIAITSARRDVVFGTVLFGRMQAGAGSDQAMGLFMNTLPLRLDLATVVGVEDSVRSTHQRLADLLRHEHAPLVLAQRCSGVSAPAPLFSALLNYRHNKVLTEEDASILEGIEWLGAKRRTNFPLTLAVEDYGQALGLTAQVAQPLSPTLICDFMQRALEQLVEALEVAPATPL